MVTVNELRFLKKYAVEQIKRLKKKRKEYTQFQSEYRKRMMGVSDVVDSRSFKHVATATIEGHGAIKFINIELLMLADKVRAIDIAICFLMGRPFSSIEREYFNYSIVDLFREGFTRNDTNTILRRYGQLRERQQTAIGIAEKILGLGYVADQWDLSDAQKIKLQEFSDWIENTGNPFFGDVTRLTSLFSDENISMPLLVSTRSE